MGILRLALGEGTTMMKLLISACLVAPTAVAEPKADADPYYGYYGLGYHGLGYGLRAYGYGYPYAYGPTDTTARGLLTPSPPLPLRLRLLLIPTTDTTALATTVLDTVPTVATTGMASATTDTATVCTDTTVRCPSNSSQPKTSLEIASRTSEKWIATFGLIPTSATVSVPPC